MIVLPDLFEKKLLRSPTLMSDVRKTLENFEPWLEQSGMPFFPGFTDHSPRHINDVLTTASSLISDEAHQLLSPEDITVLVIAALLHDSGMHLTQDGFRALVEKDGTPIIQGLGDRPWNQMWTEFLAEASRFGEERLFAVFGDTEPISVSNLDLKNLSEKDCLLGGEFVRRHHARLAHEIAIDRVPMASNMGLEIIGLDSELRDLAGLVARSHGMTIRSTFPYLESKYGRVHEYRNVKTPFLMAVLRIADYVQVKSDRAIKSLLSIKELRSPISRQEWRNHFAVRDVTTRHEDPEAMYVHATPTDVKTFLRLSSLFEDIQRELDRSWATIGEVYGRMGDLSGLGINIRRLLSNIDDSKRFAATVPYIPIKASFATSGPELLKLLVGPLYDYDYRVGIRELVQNSVDACKERSDLTAGENYTVLVEIDETSEETGWVSVTDTGVGMSLDTVVNYFLIAGASFRNSDVWKQQHTNSNGESKILRGGRFGVGALAAFLLGDEITVKTRHLKCDETEGLEFSAKIDDPIIELRKSKLPIGTSIKVWISNPSVMERLRPKHHEAPFSVKNPTLEINSWEAIDWFAQSIPDVAYHWTGSVERWDQTQNRLSKIKAKAIFHPKKHLVPINHDDHWFDLPNPNPYKRIAWQYPAKEKIKDGEHEYWTQSSAQVVVNGIRVQTIKDHNHKTLSLTKEERFEGPSFIIIRPSIAIYDPSGLCPINLQRSSVAFDRMGIEDRLGQEILHQFVDYCLASAPSELTLSSYSEYGTLLQVQPSVKFISSSTPPICATKNGFFLATPRFFKQLKIRRLFFIRADSWSPTPLSTILSEGDALLVSNMLYQGEQFILAWFRAIYSSSSEHWRATHKGFPQLMHSEEFGFVEKKTWTLATAKGKVAQQILRRLISKNGPNDKIFLRSDSCKDSQAEEQLLLLEKMSNEIGVDCEISCWVLDPLHEDSSNTDSKSPLCNEWLDRNGTPLLKIS